MMGDKMNNRDVKPGWIIFIVILLAVSCFRQLAAQENAKEDAFARYLYLNGEYYRAATEYMRLLFHSTDTSSMIQLRRNIALCYYSGADYDGFTSYLDMNRDFFRIDPLIKSEMELYLAKTYYHRQKYYNAINTLTWISSDRVKFSGDEIQFMLGLSYARIYDWDAAYTHLRLIQDFSPRKKTADDFCRAVESARLLPTRQPWLAGVFSAVIPGAGYLYCDRPGTALISFVVNGLFIWTVRDALHSHQYGLASAAAFLGAGWYVGNIAGSADAANKCNSEVRNQFVSAILDSIDVIHLPSGNGAAADSVP